MRRFDPTALPLRFVVLLALAGSLPHAFAAEPSDGAREDRETALPVFQSDPVPRAFDRVVATSSAAIRERLVRVDLRAFDPARPALELPLFGLENLRADRSELQFHDLDSYTWRGDFPVGAGRGGAVTLSVRHGVVAGLIQTPEGATYELRPIGGAQHLLSEIEPNRFRECADPLLQPSPAGGHQEQLIAADGDGTVDVLVLYTDDARAAAGGTSAIEATVQNAVDIANTAYANSQVTLRMRLVHTAELSYAETGDAQSDLIALRSNTAVSQLRDQHGADIVSLVVETSNYCGIGYLMSSLSTGFAPYAYNIAARSCVAANLTLAHEAGHNMGCDHDPANAGGAQLYSFNRGHYVNGSYRTVMAYNTQCPAGCARVPYFSNPAIDYSGQPTGVAGERDNHQVLNAVAATVAAFKTTSGGSTGGGTSGGNGSGAVPAAPAKLSLVKAGAGTLQLKWVDSSSNESGFRLYRWIGDDWALEATLAANTGKVKLIGLPRKSSQSFVVRAFNAKGESALSNRITVKTK